MKWIGVVLGIGLSWVTQAQTLPKVHHAEPLYLDLVRDLGAHKGEKEFNLGAGFQSKNNFLRQAYLMEYEFAPFNRLAFEAEVDFSIYSGGQQNEGRPKNKIDELRLSSQYTFFVSEKAQTSAAVGYTHIWESSSTGKIMHEQVYNPFFVLAKRWGKRFHSLEYLSFLNYEGGHQEFQANTSVHYALPKTSHFIGVEMNQAKVYGKWETTLRPQIKIKISPQLSLGCVTGIPIGRNENSVSGFYRLIYEL